jgi:uncharacterized protein YndB with AHSA1/START domain
MAAEPLTASVRVSADPARVFEFFTRAEAMVRWMGDYAVLDATPGGDFVVDINGVPVRGRYVEVEAPHRLVITWGHAGSERLPPGASRVEVRFVAVDDGTLVEVTHEGLPEPEVDGFARGWPFFLGRLAETARPD